MQRIPDQYRDHPEFRRYFEIWQHNEASFVFVPLADMLRRGGFLEEAREVCLRGLKHHPDSVSGRLVLASIYWELGQRAEAHRLASEILERMPSHPEARKFLGGATREVPLTMQTLTMAEILAGQGAYREACEIVQLLLQREPENERLRGRLQQWWPRRSSR